MRSLQAQPPQANCISYSSRSRSPRLPLRCSSTSPSSLLVGVAQRARNNHSLQAPRPLWGGPPLLSTRLTCAASLSLPCERHGRAHRTLSTSARQPRWCWTDWAPKSRPSRRARSGLPHAADCGRPRSRTVGADILARRREVVCRPWRSPNVQLFPKSALNLNVRDRTITCPGGQTQSSDFGTQVEFEPAICDACSLRARCTGAKPGRGRTVSIAENEQLQQRPRTLIATRPAKLRERTTVEHQLSHLVRRQGRRARYLGVRKKTFDPRRGSGHRQPGERPRLKMGLEVRKVAS